MQTKSFAIIAGTFALGLAILIPSRAQGPLYDTVKVNLPYTVTVGAKTIQPGDYMIKELPSQDNNHVLVVYSDNGLKFEVLATTIPTYDPQTLTKSEVTLHHIGNDYYLDKVWVQGKNYGYQFPLPRNLKEREKEEAASVSLPATVQTTAAENNTADNKETQTAETAQNTPPPAAPESTPAPAPAAEPVAPEPAPAPEIAQNTAPAPVPEATGDANREELPHTSAGWLVMLLSGGSLSGVGLMLRRRS